MFSCDTSVTNRGLGFNILFEGWSACLVPNHFNFFIGTLMARVEVHSLVHRWSLLLWHLRPWHLLRHEQSPTRFFHGRRV